MFCNIDRSDIHRQGHSKLAQAAFGIASNKKLSMKLKLIPLQEGWDALVAIRDLTLASQWSLHQEAQLPAWAAVPNYRPECNPAS